MTDWGDGWTRGYDAAKRAYCPEANFDYAEPTDDELNAIDAEASEYDPNESDAVELDQDDRHWVAANGRDIYTLLVPHGTLFKFEVTD